MKSRAFFRQRPLVVLAVCFAPGIWLGNSLPANFPWWIPTLGILLGALGFFLIRRNKLPRFLALGLAFAFLGMLLGWTATNPSLPPEGNYRVHATVQGESTLDENGRQVKALPNDVSLVNEQGQEWALSKVYWTYYIEEEGPLPLDGQGVAFEGRLYHPEGRVNPYGFDFKAYLLQKGIPAGISGARELALTPNTLTQPRSIWLRARQGIAHQLDLALGEHSELAKALLLGVRSGLEEDLSRNFRLAGIAHVLAVSGLHVGFLVYGLKKLLGFLHLSPRATFFIFLAFLLMYCRLLDFSPSVVRASILSLLFLGGKVLKRRVDPLTSLAAAFLVILMVRPLDLFNLGFQLSFLAVLGIFTLGDRLNAVLDGWPHFQTLPAFLKATLKAYAITLSATTFTLVPLVNAFHQFSLAGLIINPIAVLCIGWLLAGFILLLAISFLSLKLAVLVAIPVKGFADAYEGLVAFFAKQPWSSLRVGAIPAWWFAALLFLMFLITRYSAFRHKAKRILATALMIVLIIPVFLPGNQALRYIQLSSGNADSAVILDKDSSLVIDTGTHGGDLVSLLLSEGRIIDQLLLTHLHDDHAGGLQQILESGIPVKEILLPFGAEDAKLVDDSLKWLEAARAKGIPIKELGRGDVLKSGRAWGEVLWPYKNALYPGMDPNRGSLVVYWDLMGTSLMTVSDLHKDYAPYVLRPAQVLKVAHHGSGSDNKQEFLALVSPDLAVITADDYRIERSQQTRETLDKMGLPWLLTGQTGAITLTFTQEGMGLETYKTGGD